MSVINVEAYLNFNGRTEEALNFYKEKLGAEQLFLMRFNESPEPCPEGSIPPGFGDKVMHCSFKIGATQIMASDGCTDEAAEFKGFSLTLNLPTEADADHYFAALADGGKVQMPLEKTFFARKFGMVQDRFGVAWIVIVLP